MIEYSFKLNLTSGVQQVRLSELYGHLELAINNTGTEGAIALLNGLLVQRGQNPVPLQAEDIVVAERDRLLAEVYAYTYGPKIESTVNCAGCSRPYDLDFYITDLLQHTTAFKDQVEVEKTGDNEYTTKEYKFRLPTGRDEVAIADYPIEQAVEILMERCLLDGVSHDNYEEIQLRMELIAPVLDTDMLAVCPECGKEQTVRFNIQSFILERLVKEQKQLVREIHHMASSYHWRYNEILDIPRSLRKKYVELLDI